MVYSQPPLTISAVLATNAVAGNISTHTGLLPVPGATQRYRLIKFGFRLAHNTAAATIVRFSLFRDGAAAIELWGCILNVPGRGDAHVTFDFPGIPLSTVNQAVVFQSQATAAAVGFVAWAHYYNDSVS